MIQTEISEGVAVLRLAHGKANALDLELSERLLAALDDIAPRDDVRALVITGTGHIFSAGVDLFRLVGEGPEYVDRFLPALTATFERLFAFPHPAIAAINGHAIAGGCVLACACDYRLMARGSGTIGVPELRVGVPFPLIAIEIMRFAVSAAHLQELIYRGATHGAEEAMRRGLVDEVVDAADLEQRAFAVARSLAAEPAARFRITKQQLRRPVLRHIESAALENDHAVLEAWRDPQTIGTIREYLAELKARP